MLELIVYFGECYNPHGKPEHGENMTVERWIVLRYPKYALPRLFSGKA